MSKDDPGKLSLVDAIVPPLGAGDYTLTARQELPGLTSIPFQDSKTFSVRAPRFTLEPQEIYSIYPPDAQEGAYADTIPHVVFKRRTLPWERELVATRGGPRKPWMALLMLNEKEFEGGKVRIDTIQVRDLFTDPKPAGDPRGPKIAEERADRLSPDPQKKEQPPATCMTVTMNWMTFRKVAPRLETLHYLAHARKVETDHKEDVAGIGDGWFSVLLGNRAPLADSVDKIGMQYFVLLVSLEGFADLIKEKPPELPPENVRLVLLSQWKFRSKGKTFRELLGNLAGKNRDAWLRIMPLTNVKDETVKTALDMGYIPMRHKLRMGSSTVSWYRGPLVPYDMLAVSRDLGYRSADSALRLDPQSGMFDVAYACAWQLGRLLALQTPEFARMLFHQKSGRLADALVTQARETKIDGLTEAEELLQNELMAAIALEWWGDDDPSARATRS
jgi:hypothetical protein